MVKTFRITKNGVKKLDNSHEAIDEETDNKIKKRINEILGER